MRMEQGLFLHKEVINIEKRYTEDEIKKPLILWW